MARRRHKRQAAAPLAPLVFIMLVGAGISVNQARINLIPIFGFLLLCILTIGVILFIIAKNKRDRLSRSGIEEIDEMPGLQFEKYLQALLLRRGYANVRLTGNHDLGVDLI